MLRRLILYKLDNQNNQWSVEVDNIINFDSFWDRVDYKIIGRIKTA